MRVLLRTIACCGLIGLCTLDGASAAEGWQATSWGDSFERVKATYPAAEVNPDIKIACTSTLKARLLMPFDSGDYHFKAVFCFARDDTLSAVRIFLLNSGYGFDVISDLEGKYGLSPKTTGGEPYNPRTWIDGSTRIECFDDKTAFGYAPGGPGRSVFISYSRAISSSGKGL